MRSAVVWTLCAAAGLAACGGGQDAEPTAARPSERPANLGGTQVTAGELMDWAERNFAVYFPTRESNQTSAPYVYRYYPGTQNYLGLDDDRIYVLGPISGGNLQFVGTVYQYACDAKIDVCVAPALDSQPSASSVLEGKSVNFEVSASGGPSITYQWLRNGQSVAGAQSSSYTIETAARGDDGASYAVRVANAKGVVTSEAAALSVTARVDRATLEALMQANGCVRCHGVTTRVIGPSYTQVSGRYTDRRDALSYIASKIRDGSSGVWGGSMPPNAVSAETAATLAAGILSLGS